MKVAILAITVLSAVSIVGCFSQNAALEQAKAEADAAKTELAKVKAEADAAKAELALLKAQLAGNESPAGAEATVTKAVQDFFADLHNGFYRNAYQSMSLAYQKRTDYEAFEQFLEINPALRDGGGNWTENGNYKARKLGNENAYECEFATLALGRMDWRQIKITMRLVEEEGRWKIDDFVEVKDTKWEM